MSLVPTSHSQEIETPCFLSWREGEAGQVNLRVKWEPDEPQAASVLRDANDTASSSSSSPQNFVYSNRSLRSRELSGQVNLRQFQESSSNQIIVDAYETSRKARDQGALAIIQNPPKEAKIRDDEKCVVCMEAQKLVVFYKCGHICCCLKCAPRFVKSRCPMCRQRVIDFIKIFRI